MRRILGTLLLISFATAYAVAAVPEARDDHDDKAPVQSGYGVITPVAATSGGTAAGLVVFETFGFRENSGTPQAGVLPPDLTTNAILFVDSDPHLSKNLAAGIGGPGAVLLPQFAAGGGWATEFVLANTGTSAITVRVDLFKNDGTPLTAALNGQTASSFQNLTIPADGVITLAPRDSHGDDDF